MVYELLKNSKINEFYPQIEKETLKSDTNKKASENRNTVVVSKEFILNILSLSIGKPFFLESNLGRKIDIKL